MIGSAMLLQSFSQADLRLPVPGRLERIDIMKGFAANPMTMDLFESCLVKQ